MISPLELEMDRPMRAGAGYLTAIRRRPRLWLCLGLGLVVYLVTPGGWPTPTRALVGWNVGCFGYLGLVARMMASGTGDVRDHAAEEDEKTFALLIVAIAAAAAALIAILFELGPVKDFKGYDKAAHLALVGATILSAWAFTHIMFALHYAAEYFADRGDGEGGLVFPKCDKPGWGEFCYQAFVIGCACATADVNVTTPTMRSACVIQGVVAFAFNTVILALTINIGAGLIGT